MIETLDQLIKRLNELAAEFGDDCKVIVRYEGAAHAPLDRVEGPDPIYTEKTVTLVARP